MHPVLNPWCNRACSGPPFDIAPDKYPRGAALGRYSRRKRGVEKFVALLRLFNVARVKYLS
jgi:hypothetical protein